MIIVPSNVSAAKSPVGYRGGALENSRSITLPTHQIGDIIVVVAQNSGYLTIPIKPSASGTVPTWTTIETGNGTTTSFTQAYHVVYAVATATNTTSGDWTGASRLIAAVAYGQGSSPIGGHAGLIGEGAYDVTVPAITQTATDGTSLLLQFAHRLTGTGADSVSDGYSVLLNTTWGGIATKNSSTSDGSMIMTGSDYHSYWWLGYQLEICA